MKLLFKIGFFIIIAFNLILASWYVLHQDIQFSTDIGRDFLLLQELDQKKIVLIGPKSSTNLFHGPLWTYVNYPAYLVGNGNPVVVGWFWILLIIPFLVSGFYIAKDLFNREVAYLFTLMLSVYMVFHVNGLYNPHGALFLTPAFFYFFIKYIKTSKVKFLILHLLIASFVIQFQMAVGIPFLILSFLFISFKAKKKVHLIYFLLIPLLLSNFIIFDLRHDHLLLNTLQGFLSPQSSGHIFNYLLYLPKRLDLMLGGVEIIRQDSGNRNLVLFMITLFFIYKQIKDNKNRVIYFSFLYFYFGFFVLSLINKGDILYFHFFPIFPLVFLIFSSLFTSKYKKIFLILFLAILLFNETTAVSDTKNSQDFIGKNIYSWKALFTISSKVFNNNDKNFGYFVYAPNTVAYEGKYAADYANRIFKANAYKSEKKIITYLIIAPPPNNNPYMLSDWWIINKVHISKNPVSETAFENSYKIQKYLFTDEEVKVLPDPNIDLGIFFR